MRLDNNGTTAVLIADAYLKGIRGFDMDTLYEAMLKNSENEGPLQSVGRLGCGGLLLP